MFCSVLISNYNKSKYIKKCLNSVLNQTYENIEIIFFDNNSEDDSIDIASKFENINIYQSPRNTNAPALNQLDLINKAFLKSKGEYIFLLDSDDFYKEDKIEKIINFKKKNNYEFVCDVPRMIYDNGKIIDFKKKSSFNFFRSWPIIYPTSSLSFTRNFFLKFQKNLFLGKFSKLEIDFRLNVFAQIEKEYRVMTEDFFTYYNQTNEGIMSKYRKYDKNWWSRRLQGHLYLERITLQKNYKFSKNLDYYLTNLINKINLNY